MLAFYAPASATAKPAFQAAVSRVIGVILASAVATQVLAGLKENFG